MIRKKVQLYYTEISNQNFRVNVCCFQFKSGIYLTTRQRRSHCQQEQLPRSSKSHRKSKAETERFSAYLKQNITKIAFVGVILGNKIIQGNQVVSGNNRLDLLMLRLNVHSMHSEIFILICFIHWATHHHSQRTSFVIKGVSTCDSSFMYRE